MRCLLSGLEFVCKQLYAETVGLELQSNNVVFNPDGEVIPTNPYESREYSAEQMLLAYTAPMTANKLSWLSTVTIATSLKGPCLQHNLGPYAAVEAGPAIPHFPALVTFAKQNPAIKVRYQFLNFAFNYIEYGLSAHTSRNFTCAGVALMIAFRSIQGAGKEALKLLLEDDGDVCDRAEAWGKIWHVAGQLKGVSNFVVWPMERRGQKKHLRYLEEEAH
jgi:hypothetical protein